MKKITVALIALGMAVAANAASVSWSVTAGKAYVGYDVYLTTIATFSSLDDVTSNLLGASGASGTMGLATATARNATATGSVVGLNESSTYSFYYVLVNENNQYWVSDKVTFDTNAETAAAASVQFAAANANALLGAEATGTLAVPEPTSGLLLLLGVAGLALKRKRA